MEKRINQSNYTLSDILSAAQQSRYPTKIKVIYINFKTFIVACTTGIVTYGNKRVRVAWNRRGFAYVADLRTPEFDLKLQTLK